MPRRTKATARATRARTAHDVMRVESCGVATCPALATGDEGFCAVHAGSNRAAHVMAGTTCPACGRPIEPGDYVTRGSTMETMTHAICPPRRPSLGRRKDRSKPLLEAAAE